MKVTVWGAGAIGGTIGATLARAGHEVLLVDRAADHVAAINTRGLAITGPIAEFTARAPAATPDQVEGEFEMVLLCVKAQDTEAAVRTLLPHLQPEGAIVSVQNGLNELLIAELAGRARTIGAFVNFGADYLQPGVIHYGGRGSVVLGELDGASTPRLAALHRTLLDFDDGAVTTDNIWGFLWTKLAYGALLFATALTNESIADALAMPAYRDLFAALAREVVAVARAQDIRLEPFTGFDPSAFRPGADRAEAERALDDLVAFNRRSAKTHSGIWRDLAVRRRRTEVDPQLGPIVALGRQKGVPAPLTARLVEMIHEIEAGERRMDLANLDVLKESMG